MRDDEAQDVGALRAERHAHADLMCALHDEERHHAVNPDGSENERDSGKNVRSTTERRRGATDSAITCSSVRTWAIGCAGSIACTSRRIALVRLRGSCALRTARITVGKAPGQAARSIPACRGIETAMMNVGDDADDCAPVFPSRLTLMRLPKRFLVRPITFRQHLIDDNDGWRIGLVCGCKEAAL